MRKHSRSVAESPKMGNRLQSYTRSFRKIPVKNQTVTLQNEYYAKVKVKPQDLKPIKPAYQTVSNFFANKTPISQGFPQEIGANVNLNMMTTQNFNPAQRIKNDSSNNSASKMKKFARRTQTVSTGLSGMRPTHGLRSVNSMSSMTNLVTPGGSRHPSRVVTPYQDYKIRRASKRKVFTNQLVPSKNKILPPTVTAHFGQPKGKFQF